MSKKQNTVTISAADYKRLLARIEGLEKAKAPKAKKALKPLSSGEILKLRRKGASWVTGKADWQLQGRERPANAIATGSKVSKKVLAAHGYCRPEGHVKAKIAKAKLVKA